jgi:tRNA(Ile)-lysidine synthase
LNLSVQAAEALNTLTGIFDGLTGVPRLAVAVSGGSDSMALLHLVAQWSLQQNGPSHVFALTVDHGLRSGSDFEAMHVARWCAALQVPHVSLSWLGEKPTSGIQAKARQARYDLLARWCRENAVPVLMTGHTADDQAETVYMRQRRTSSVKSLAGIWPENQWLNVRVLRPLLAMRRETLRLYLQSLGAEWLDDPSNDNPKFERVRVRQALVGVSIENLNAVATASQQAVQDMRVLMKAWKANFWTVDDYGVVRLKRQALQFESMALQNSILGQAIQIAGDGGAPDAAGLDALAAWVQQGALGRRSLNGAIVNGRQNVVEVMREPGRLRDRWVTVPESGEIVFDGRFHITAPAGSSVGPIGFPAQLKRFKDVPALAFSALPAVKLPDGEVVCAVKCPRDEVSAVLCERFRY